MRVDIIEDIDEFTKIRKDWDGVYGTDPEAHPCLSWKWLDEYLSSRRRWFLLALRREQSDAHYSAFLPIEVTTYLDEGSGLFCDEVSMIGNCGTGRTGLLCTPDLEIEAVDASAGLLLKENWARMKVEFLDPGSPRLERLLHAFPVERFVREDGGGVRNDLGGREGGSHCMLLKTRSGHNLGNSINHRSIEFVFERAIDLHAQGALERAETAYRQIVLAAPQHVHARYGLAQLCCDKGDFAEAEYIYRALLSTAPHDRILHRLGDTQMAQGMYQEASETFESLLDSHPHQAVIRYKLAVCLLAAGRREAAIATFLSFEDIDSDDADHIRCKLKSREAAWHLKTLAVLEELRADADRPQMAMPCDKARLSCGRAAVPPARLFGRAPLLKPSMPKGISVNLHARPTPFDGIGSRSKH